MATDPTQLDPTQFDPTQFDVTQSDPAQSGVARSEGAAGWDFYAVVGTSVQGGHTLARFGPESTALAALRLAVQSVHRTAFAILEQGVPGEACVDARLLERLPITDFSVERHHVGHAEPDASWALTGGRHHRVRSRRAA